ncbi:MAG TPA: DEAD/DEAH box helicase [Gammaproteobacteria bacterium]|nr:DEAD/DEAH box helicase [Gammaproteobacteria bacterium]
MSFEQLKLNTQITKALALCGYTIPTPIQTQSIPDILLGRDMVASAQTGTGKTAAFVLPALHRLVTTPKTGNTPRILILTPTRELATQITDAVGKYGKFLRCQIASLVGGMPYRQQLRSLSRPVDIIIATPGRLMDHMSNGRLDLSDIEMLILDEADRMLDMGFIDDVKHIASVMPLNRQTLLFSATVDDRLTQIIRQFLRNPVRIDIASEKMAPAKITQQLYLVDNPLHKTKLFMHLVKELNIFKAIIFSSTKVNADRLADELYEAGFTAAALHGDLKQSMRTRTLDQLRRGRIQFLVATDVAARGIDIQDITHVINFDLPKFAEDYVHRIGRTGRAGKEGIAISLALPSDGRHIQRIERLLRQGLERVVVPGMEPKKQLSSAHLSDKKSGHKKKFGDKSSRGKKEFAREGFAKRKDRKEFGSDRGSFASRKPKKEFGGDREGFAPRKPRKELGGDRDGFAPRKPRKELGDDRKEFAPRTPRKEFGGDRKEFAPRTPRKEFGGDRKEFAPRTPKKEFRSDRSGFASPRPKNETDSKITWKPRKESDKKKRFTGTGKNKPFKGRKQDN